VTRQAILIESSNVGVYDDLPGARADVSLLRNWLMTPRGGAWESAEIGILRNPTVHKVRKWLKIAKLCNYAFVSFSGHGHHVIGSISDETRLCLNDDEEISAKRLNPGNARCTILIDACRGVTVEIEATLLERRVKAMTQLALNLTREAARAKFDDLVARSERGAIYIYSCCVDESAGDSKQGGLFTIGLVRAGELWKPKKGKYVSVMNAFRSAERFTNEENPQQNPVIEAGRRIRYFPFAIPF
jgi:caspase domain-containing protein